MIQEDRLSKILALIEAKKSISVNELKDALFVSVATIRRDLSELSRRGLIIRSFGGAVALTVAGRSAQKQESPSPVPSNPIGLSAAELVPDGSRIFIGGSPVSRSMLHGLKQKSQLEIITDSLTIAEALVASGNKVICTGGTYMRALNLFTGKQAAEVCQRYRYDYAFIYFDAVSADGKLYDNCLEKLYLIDVLKNNAKNLVLLVPKASLWQEAANILLNLSDINIVVTDCPEFFEPVFKGAIIKA